MTPAPSEQTLGPTASTRSLSVARKEEQRLYAEQAAENLRRMKAETMERMGLA